MAAMLGFGAPSSAGPLLRYQNDLPISRPIQGYGLGPRGRQFIVPSEQTRTQANFVAGMMKSLS